jgi:hypothetical protein
MEFITKPITREQFESYVEVQRSGITNMMNVSLVGGLAGLSKEQCLVIMQNYNVLAGKYLPENNTDEA